jgi:hypothetical protein
MSEKKEAFKVIQGDKENISDAEFQIFLNAFLGPYKGGYNPE